MMQHRLQDELDRVAARYRHLRFWQGLAAAWLLAALAGLSVLALKTVVGGFALAIPAIVAAALLLAAAGVWLAVASARNPVWIARQIEAAFPELRTCLLAAVEQRPELPGGRFGYLQANVIHQALLHAHRQRWEQVVPTRRIAWAMVANAATLSLLVVVLFAIGFAAGSSPEAIAALSGAGPLAGSGQFTVTVEPGDTEVEKGTSLLVLARVAGDIPAEATLVYASASGDQTSLTMSRSLDDPLFGKSISGVTESLVYKVEIGRQTTPEYRVTVFEYPRMERADAKLAYPKYTGLEDRLVQDVRTVTVVEGTELTLICHLNKPVAKATLVEERAEPIELTATTTSDQPVWEAKIVCDRTRRLKLHLVDEAGRKNVQPPSFTINVTPNRPVALKPVFPARDLEASPLEEIDARATAWDDYGVARYGVVYALAGEEPVELVLGEKAAARERHEIAHAIRLEELNAEPDELLAYHWWAEDLDSGGQPRRVESDMYFAEVRHFEEIFRQGEQPPGGQQQQQQGQGQNAQQAQQLAQLQKQIINATWKVIRREIGEQLTDAFGNDVEEIVKSQETALEQAAALAGRVQDAESQEHVAAVLRSMQEAVTQLTTAKDGPAKEPLQPALAAEQAAYQALLKLRAREHRVTRQQRQQQQRGSASQQARSQQQQRQLDQLDLQNERNPYESQRLAQDQQAETPEAREDRQVLNRLRELARRQHDLNERLKELQAALEEARTEEQKEEIRRQLKRLQEEQRQVLEDTDELQSRMEQSENQERMAEERQQLEETREQVRRASEALEQEMVTQAAASGTRAEREFEELRNEFRRRNSGRFNEEMREMREAAQELDQRQQQVAERLEEPNAQEQDQEPSKAKSKAKAKSLSDGGQQERAAEELAQQRERLANLREQMRQTIAEAEETEPLLTERLYEAARGAEERKLDQALQATESSVRRGLTEDARQQEEAARRGIGQLREGIERAAEAVLGDETEALRRAREELQNLSRELNEEIARNNPDAQRQPGQQQPGERQPGEQQPGEQPDGQRQPGQRQPGQRQPGQRQPGQQQPGQQQQQGQQDGQQQPGQPQDGQQQDGQQQDGQQQDGQRQGGRQQANRGDRDPRDRGGRRLTDVGPGGNAEMFDRDDREYAPLTGEDFRNWSDRLRDVEEMVDDPELRAEAARIRDRARAVRAEFKRHSATPQWDLVQDQIAEPLVQLRERVAEELLRRSSQQAIVPLDRDPVPPQYSEKTRLYYERLGTGK